MDFYTNNTEANKYIDARIASLPKEVSSVINNTEVFEKLNGFLKTKGLHGEKIQIIQYEVFLILMQLKPVEEFEVELISEVDLSTDMAIEISEYTQREIFGNVLEHLGDLPNEEENAGEVIKKAEPIKSKEELRLRPEGVVQKETEMPKVSENDDNDAQPITKEELHSSLSARRTMAEDVEKVKSEKSENKDMPIKTKEEIPHKKPEIPRYSKPLTGLPNYDNDSKERGSR